MFYTALDLEHVSNGCPILTGMNGEFDDEMNSPEYEQNDAVAACNYLRSGKDQMHKSRVFLGT